MSSFRRCLPVGLFAPEDATEAPAGLAARSVIGVVDASLRGATPAMRFGLAVDDGNGKRACDRLGDAVAEPAPHSRRLYVGWWRPPRRSIRSMSNSSARVRSPARV